MTRHKVLLIDDHPLLRAGVRHVIDSDPRFQVVGEGGDGPEARRLATSLRPDVIVMDLDLPGGDGLAVMRSLQADGIQVPVVILSMHKRQSLLEEAIAVGASAYVLKDNAPHDLLEALRASVRGDQWYSPALSGFLLGRRRQREQLTLIAPGLQLLTPAERRVLHLVSLSLTSREIAHRLGSSPLTIETHRRNIGRKLGLEGSHRLLQFALRHASILADDSSN